MNKLADAVVHYIRAILFYHEGNIDVEYAVHEWETLPELLGTLSSEERTALSQSAQRTLDFYARPPDEYGYKPQISDNETAFLRDVASGELYDQIARHLQSYAPHVD